MEVITIQVRDKQHKRFLLQLLSELSFVDILPNASHLTEEDRRFVSGLKLAIRDVERHQNGELSLKTAEQLAAEL